MSGPTPRNLSERDRFEINNSEIREFFTVKTERPRLNYWVDRFLGEDKRYDEKIHESMKSIHDFSDERRVPLEEFKVDQSILEDIEHNVYSLGVTRDFDEPGGSRPIYGEVLPEENYGQIAVGLPEETIKQATERFIDYTNLGFWKN